MRWFNCSVRMINYSIVNKMNKEYTILEKGKPIVIVDDLQVAIQMVRNLEAKMDRYTTHSSYTIEQTS